MAIDCSTLQFRAVSDKEAKTYWLQGIVTSSMIMTPFGSLNPNLHRGQCGWSIIVTGKCLLGLWDLDWPNFVAVHEWIRIQFGGTGWDSDFLQFTESLKCSLPNRLNPTENGNRLIEFLCSFQGIPFPPPLIFPPLMRRGFAPWLIPHPNPSAGTIGSSCGNSKHPPWLFHPFRLSSRLTDLSQVHSCFYFT